MAVDDEFELFADDLFVDSSLTADETFAFVVDDDVGIVS